MYQFIPLEPDYLCEILLRSNVATDKDKAENETWTLKLENLYKVVSETELNSCPNSSVG